MAKASPTNRLLNGLDDAKAVTASDSTDLSTTFGSRCPNRLWVGASGDVQLTLDSGNVLFKAVAAGQWHQMPNFTKVMATNTTATGIVVGVAVNDEIAP